jgi:aldose 1-epimerase
VRTWTNIQFRIAAFTTSVRIPVIFTAGPDHTTYEAQSSYNSQSVNRRHRHCRLMLALASAPLRLIVRPEIGGSIARFDWVGSKQPVPLFRPWDGGSDDPNRQACYPLVPWSNRISGGGIVAGGRFWPLRPNWPGEPYPMHGDGWRRPWRVERHADAELVLALDSADQPPFAYRAELTYALAGNALTMRLGVENRAAVATPYGLGFHPWLPRTPDTLLELRAAEVSLETADHLPAGKVPVTARPD